MLDISKLKFDENGLIPAIVTDSRTKEVLTLAYMNRESLSISLEKKLTCTEVTSEDPVPTAEIREADAGKLERLYRNYPDEKLRKILESKEYREDAKKLAEQILKARAELAEEE